MEKNILVNVNKKQIEVPAKSTILQAIRLANETLMESPIGSARKDKIYKKI